MVVCIETCYLCRQGSIRKILKIARGDASNIRVYRQFKNSAGDTGSRRWQELLLSHRTRIELRGRGTIRSENSRGDGGSVQGYCAIVG